MLNHMVVGSGQLLGLTGAVELSTSVFLHSGVAGF